MSELLELADRVESATGPDRELDCLIAHSLGCSWGEPPRTVIDIISDDRSWGRDVGAPWTAEEWRMTADGQGVLAYTASLDAAMTLVPEGWRIEQLGEWYDWPLRSLGAWQAHLYFPQPRINDGGSGGPADLTAHCQHAATPALALCSAALRARAAQTPENGHE